MSTPPALAGVSAQEIEQCLNQALAPDQLLVQDESAAHAGHAGSNGLGHGTHFRVRIASSHFAGKSRVACHRLVYDALQAQFARGLHALAIELC